MSNRRRYYNYESYRSRAPGQIKHNFGKGFSYRTVQSINRKAISKYRNKMRKKGYWDESDFQYMDTGYDPYYYKSRILVPEPMEFNTYSPSIMVPSLRQFEGAQFFHHLVFSHQNFSGVSTSVNLLELNVDFCLKICESNTILLKPNFFLVAAPNPYYQIERYKNIAGAGARAVMVPKTELDMYNEVNRDLSEIMTSDTRVNPDLAAIGPNNDTNVPYHEIETVRASKYEIDRKCLNQLTSSGTGFHTIKFRFKGSKSKGDVVLNPGDAIFIVCWVSAQSLNDETELHASSQSTCMFTKN